MYVCISGDFDRAVVDEVDAAVDGSCDGPVRGVVLDLSAVTFLDGTALASILRADQRGRHDGFGVVVVRPPALVGRVFTLTGAADRLTVVDHAWEVAFHDGEGRRFETPVTSPIRFAALVLGDPPICVRCRITPSAWEGGEIVKGRVMLVSARDGPICRGCATISEQIELGETILRQLRRSHPRDGNGISALEDALAELRRSQPIE